MFGIYIKPVNHILKKNKNGICLHCFINRYLDKKYLTQYKSICLKGLDLEEISTIAFIPLTWRDNNNNYIQPLQGILGNEKNERNNNIRIIFVF